MLVSSDPKIRSGYDGALGSDFELGGDVLANPSGLNKRPILDRSEGKWELALTRACLALFRATVLFSSHTPWSFPHQLKNGVKGGLVGHWLPKSCSKWGLFYLQIKGDPFGTWFSVPEASLVGRVSFPTSEWDISGQIGGAAADAPLLGVDLPSLIIPTDKGCYVTPSGNRSCGFGNPHSQKLSLGLPWWHSSLEVPMPVICVKWVCVWIVQVGP